MDYGRRLFTYITTDYRARANSKNGRLKRRDHRQATMWETFTFSQTFVFQSQTIFMVLTVIRNVRFFEYRFRTNVFPRSILRFKVQCAIRFLNGTFNYRFVREGLVGRLILTRFVMAFAINATSASATIAVVKGSRCNDLTVLANGFRNDATDAIRDRRVHNRTSQVIHINDPISLTTFRRWRRAIQILKWLFSYLTYRLFRK